MYSIKVAHHMEELMQLKEAWQSLQANSNQRQNIFHSWDWIFTYWRHFHEGGELCLVQAYDAKNKLVGLLPLMQRYKQPGSLLQLTRLELITLPPNGHHADFIIAEGHKVPVLQAFIKWFKQQQVSAEILLDGFLMDSPAIAIFEGNQLKPFHMEDHESPYVAIEGDWDSFFNSLSKVKRKDCRRKRRKLDEAYPNEWACRKIQDPEEVRRAMNGMMNLHQKKWTSHGETGHFGTPSARAFHHEMAQRLLKQGQLWLYELVIRGKPVAFDYNFACEGRVYGFSSGLDEKYYDYGVGSVLLETVLRDCFEQGMDAYDFMAGNHPYKLQWSTHSQKDLTFILPASSSAKTYRYLLETGRSIWRQGKHLMPQDIRHNLRHAMLNRMKDS